jgi:hydrogenase maturation protein HypF
VTRAPVLVIGIGNPSRGDDALGPAVVERLEELLRAELAGGQVETLVDFQLQIEHTLDISGRDKVFIVDASVSAAGPFAIGRVAANDAPSPFSHAMSPAELLGVYERTFGPAPPVWAVAVRGRTFELGAPIGDEALAHVEPAARAIVAEVRATGDRGARLTVRGTVQGVGFRPWVVAQATRLGLSGTVHNTLDGVVLEAWGSEAGLTELGRLVTEAPPAGASVESLVVEATTSISPGSGFRIAPSTCEAPTGGVEGATRVAIPPDVATCDACLAEVDDPRDRRYRYPFTSCAACGPRLAIARGLPFDRARTTMCDFPLCVACRAEYESPEDRRFHAQTIACPACGPRLSLVHGDGAAVSGSPLEAATQMLREGHTLAVMGIGAFHLVADATDSRAVASVRAAKAREEKPFAVLVESLAWASRLGEVDAVAAGALESPARPVVLVPRRPSAIVPEVFGPSEKIGLMLPSTPLHHLLVRGVGRPLVMTSGNPTGGPAIVDVDEALRRLGPKVDALLVHDRPIARRVEDSVVASTPRGLRVVRRSRGYAPHAIRLRVAAPEPIVAYGAHDRACACVVVGDRAYCTPHLGDTSYVEGERAFEHDLAGFEDLLGVRPAVVAHDLHPDYTTTRLALRRGARLHVGVQHHVAHVRAVMAEHGLDEPVVGVAFDGTGFGPDGTLWGGEILTLDGLRERRVATFRPLGLPGGERAIRDVAKVAYTALVDAFGDAEARALSRRFPAFSRLSDDTLARLSILLGLDATPRARGLGRLFDAVGALVTGLSVASFDGHVAARLEDVAAPGAHLPYPITLPSTLTENELSTTAAEIDPRPTVRAVVADLLDGASPSTVAARFHATIAYAASTIAELARATFGFRRVVLSGGAFMNRLLEDGIRHRLGEGLVSSAVSVPTNDGGIALGQAHAAVLALVTNPAYGES